MTTHQKAAQLSTHKEDFDLSSPAIAKAVFFAILDSFTCASERGRAIVDAIHRPGRAKATTPADPSFGRSFVLW